MQVLVSATKWGYKLDILSVRESFCDWATIKSQHIKALTIKFTLN